MARLEESWEGKAKALAYNSEREMLYDMYFTKGLVLKQIADILSSSTHSVRRRLMGYGFTLRRPGGPVNLGRRVLADLPEPELFNTNPLTLSLLHDVNTNTVYRERRLRKLTWKPESALQSR